MGSPADRHDVAVTHGIGQNLMRLAAQPVVHAICCFGLSVAGCTALSHILAGTGNIVVILGLFLTMPVGACAALGALFGNPKLGAIVGLGIGLVLAPFFWEVWQGANC